MTITIENPVAVEQINAFATSRGLTVDEAIIEAIDVATERLDESLNEGQKRIRQALRELAKLPFPSGVVLDDSRASYYEDDQGRLPGMDGYGRDE